MINKYFNLENILLQCIKSLIIEMWCKLIIYLISKKKFTNKFGIIDILKKYALIYLIIINNTY